MNKIPERNHITEAKTDCFTALLRTEITNAGDQDRISSDAQSAICKFLECLGYGDIADKFRSLV